MPISSMNVGLLSGVDRFAVLIRRMGPIELIEPTAQQVSGIGRRELSFLGVRRLHCHRVRLGIHPVHHQDDHRYFVPSSVE